MKKKFVTKKKIVEEDEEEVYFPVKPYSTQFVSIPNLFYLKRLKIRLSPSSLSPCPLTRSYPQLNLENELDEHVLQEEDVEDLEDVEEEEFDVELTLGNPA